MCHTLSNVPGIPCPLKYEGLTLPQARLRRHIARCGLVPSVSPMSPGAKQGHEGYLQACWFESLDFQQTGAQPSIPIPFHMAGVRQLPLRAAPCEAPWFPLNPIMSDPDSPIPWPPLCASRQCLAGAVPTSPVAFSLKKPLKHVFL